MITVDDATKILNRFSLDRIASVKLKDSFGRALAEDIVSGIDVPSFDRSDMDGYAIRDQDLDGRRFKLVGEIHAGGDLEVAIGDGECSWVATGANIPDGGNLVVPVENTEKIGDDVIVYEPGKESHISERGCDMKRGETVLKRGCIVNDRNIGILAALGNRIVPVYDAPTVAIIATGDELARIKRNIYCHIEIGVLIHINMADPVRMPEHRDLRVLLDVSHKRIRSSWDHEVDMAVEFQNLTHVLSRLDKLD